MRIELALHPAGGGDVPGSRVRPQPLQEPKGALAVGERLLAPVSRDLYPRLRNHESECSCCFRAVMIALMPKKRRPDVLETSDLSRLDASPQLLIAQSYFLAGRLRASFYFSGCMTATRTRRTYSRKLSTRKNSSATAAGSPTRA